MKKTIAFLLATAMMCCSLTVTSFAASDTTSGSTSSISTSSNSSSTSTVNETYQVTASLLYVRSGPAATDTMLGSLPKGETVSGTVSNGWLSFNYEGKAAYCNAKYLAKVAAASATSKSYTVTASKLLVRSGAGSSYSKLGILTKGETVTGTVSNGWLSFTYNGKDAYCYASYLK